MINRTPPIALLVISRLRITRMEEKKYSKGFSSDNKEILVDILSISKIKYIAVINDKKAKTQSNAVGCSLSDRNVPPI